MRVGAVYRDVKGPIAQGRRHQRDTVGDVSRHFGVGIIVKFVGDKIAAHREIRIAVADDDINLPGKLIDRHLDPVAGVRKAGHAQGGRGLESDIGGEVLARIQVEGCARTAGDADEIKLAADQVRRHHQHLAVLGQVGNARNWHRPFLDQNGIGRPVEPKPPSQRVGGNGGFEKTNSFSADRHGATAAGSIRSDSSQILHIRRAGDEVPLRTRIGAHQDEPFFPGRKRSGGHDEPIRTAAFGFIGGGVRGRQHPFLQIDVGFTGGHVQGGAPRADRGVLRDNSEIIITAGLILIGVNLGAQMRRARVPAQGSHVGKFCSQCIAHTIGGRRQEHAEKICADKRFIVGKGERVGIQRRAAL